MPEVRVAGLDRERRALEIDIDAVEAVLGRRCGVTEETKFGTRFGSASVKCCPPPPSEIITFLPWLFSQAMSALNCSVSRPAGVWNCMVPSGAFRSGVEKATRMTSHCGETSRSGNGGPAAAVAGPVADQLVAVGAPLARNGRDRGLRRRRRAPRPPRAGHGLAGSASACGSGKL